MLKNPIKFRKPLASGWTIDLRSFGTKKMEIDFKDYSFT